MINEYRGVFVPSFVSAPLYCEMKTVVDDFIWLTLTTAPRLLAGIIRRLFLALVRQFL